MYRNQNVIFSLAQFHASGRGGWLNQRRDLPPSLHWEKYGLIRCATLQNWLQSKLGPAFNIAHT
ncbi:hypothetical protein E2C01_050463 [Portunus trituberculatus]|uniref:Uncharacterized protein n=1 Tax=Portunus trituberculatus TaxID=210409 RepID=A0A5B7GC62_PORTR|nr:hypothetical protein [Portunus trituberculatus]